MRNQNLFPTVCIEWDLSEFLFINSKHFLCSIFDEGCGYILKPEISSEEMRKNK